MYIGCIEVWYDVNRIILGVYRVYVGVLGCI